MDNTVNMWNAIRKLFKRKKQHVIRASRSKLILNAEEARFCDIVTEVTILSGSSKLAVEEAAKRMALSRQVAKEWFEKPKIQTAIAAVQVELDAEAETSSDVMAGVRIMPADEGK